jgi:hypothetical protein
MAHEVFHAFQAVMSRNEANWNRVPSWLTEGSAEWVVRDVLGVHDPKALEELAYYLNTPSHPLFSRDYDAIGFFDHADGAGDAGPPAVNGLGQHEYLSVGYVRVRNVTASIQLGGNEEADGEGIYKLLEAVAGEL